MVFEEQRIPLSEVAERLGVSDTYLRRFITNAKNPLPAARVGRLFILPLRSTYRYLRANCPAVAHKLVNPDPDPDARLQALGDALNQVLANFGYVMHSGGKLIPAETERPAPGRHVEAIPAGTERPAAGRHVEAIPAGTERQKNAGLSSSTSATEKNGSTFKNAVGLRELFRVDSL